MPDEMGSRYDTWEWRRMAALAKQRAGMRCQQCGSDGPLDAHHIRPVGEGGPLLDLDNLRALCRTCHQGEHPGWADAEVDHALRERIEEGQKDRPAAGHELHERKPAEGDHIGEVVRYAAGTFIDRETGEKQPTDTLTVRLQSGHLVSERIIRQQETAWIYENIADACGLLTDDDEEAQFNMADVVGHVIGVNIYHDAYTGGARARIKRWWPVTPPEEYADSAVWGMGRPPAAVVAGARQPPDAYGMVRVDRRKIAQLKAEDKRLRANAPARQRASPHPGPRWPTVLGRGVAILLGLGLAISMVFVLVVTLFYSGST